MYEGISISRERRYSQLSNKRCASLINFQTFFPPNQPYSIASFINFQTFFPPRFLFHRIFYYTFLTNNVQSGKGCILHTVQHEFNGGCKKILYFVLTTHQYVLYKSDVLICDHQCIGTEIKLLLKCGPFSHHIFNSSRRIFY